MQTRSVPLRLEAPSQWERNTFLAKCREQRFERGKEITVAYWSEGALA